MKVENNLKRSLRASSDRT